MWWMPPVPPEGSNRGTLVNALLDICPEGELHYPSHFYTDQDPEFRISEIIREQAIARSAQEVPHALYVEIADMEFKGTERWDTGDLPRRDETPEAGKGGRDADEPDIPAGAPEGFFGEDTDEPAPPARQSLWVRAFLVVERPSQVGILVGHRGQQIKAIRIGALKELRKVFPWKISLDLRVKVNPKWRRKDPLLKRMLGPEQ